MTVIYQVPGSVKNAPLLIDYAAAFAADARVAGVYLMDDSYVTFASGLVASVANMKTGGAALTLNGAFSGTQEASMVNDPVLGRDVLHFDPSKGSYYEAPLSGAKTNNISFYLFARSLTYLNHSTPTYLVGSDAGGLPLLRYDQVSQHPTVTGASAGATGGAFVQLKDPYAWTEYFWRKDSANGVTIEVPGLPVATTPSGDVTTTAISKFDLGSGSQASVNIGCFATFNVNINAPENQDLKQLFKAFRSEACRV